MSLKSVLLTLVATGCAACGQSSSSAATAHTAVNSDRRATWVTYVDPFEQAFSLDVPQGWTARGGTFRLGYSDARLMIDLVSPDGQTNIRFGEVAIPVYAMPNRFHREGETLDLGAQAQLRVAQYRSGQEFAELYARARFRNVCTNLASQPEDWQPPVSDAIERLATAAPERSSDGQVTYRCVIGSETKAAYVHTKSSQYEGFWQVSSVVSYLTPADRIAAARAIIARCTNSLQVNPAWVQYQRQMDQRAVQYQQARQAQRRRVLSQQVAEFEVKMQGMRNQVAAFEHRQAMQASQVEGFTKTLTGLTPVMDPLGNPHDVWIGPKNGYWINGQGTIVNSDLSPGAGWQPMTRR